MLPIRIITTLPFARRNFTYSNTRSENFRRFIFFTLHLYRTQAVRRNMRTEFYTLGEHNLETDVSRCYCFITKSPPVEASQYLFIADAIKCVLWRECVEFHRSRESTTFSRPSLASHYDRGWVLALGFGFLEHTRNFDHPIAALSRGIRVPLSFSSCRCLREKCRIFW